MSSKLLFALPTALSLCQLAIAMSLQTPTPESGAGASEHVSTSAGDEMSLDGVIAKLKAPGNEDTRGQEIWRQRLRCGTPAVGIERLPLERWLLRGE